MVVAIDTRETQCCSRGHGLIRRDRSLSGGTGRFEADPGTQNKWSVTNSELGRNKVDFSKNVYVQNLSA